MDGGMIQGSRSCNRHFDCDKADKEWLVRNPKERRVPTNFHCHDDNCEDCFGC